MVGWEVGLMSTLKFPAGAGQGWGHIHVGQNPMRHWRCHCRAKSHKLNFTNGALANYILIDKN